MIRRPPRSTLFPTRRSSDLLSLADIGAEDPAVTRERYKERFPRGATRRMTQLGLLVGAVLDELVPRPDDALVYARSEEHTSELQSLTNIVCRLLLEQTKAEQ